MSGVGLAGGHSTGKTTLAKACSDNYGITFLPSNASNVIRNAGYDPAADYDFETRLYLQELILADAEASYAKMGGIDFITDRTPLDFLTYLTTDIQRNNVSEDLAEKYLAYKKRCYATVSRYFNVVVQIQPGIELVEREGRGSPNTAYVEHYNTVLSGLMISGQMNVQHTLIPRKVTDLNQRVLAVEQSLKIAFRTFDAFAKRKGAISSTISIH
jgi:hypothetical protein